MHSWLRQPNMNTNSKRRHYLKMRHTSYPGYLRFREITRHLERNNNRLKTVPHIYSSIIIYSQKDDRHRYQICINQIHSAIKPHYSSRTNQMEISIVLCTLQFEQTSNIAVYFVQFMAKQLSSVVLSNKAGYSVQAALWKPFPLDQSSIYLSSLDKDAPNSDRFV